MKRKSSVDELKQQWDQYQAAERAWFEKPSADTAQAMTDAFKRMLPIRISSVGELIAENRRLEQEIMALREGHQEADHGRD